MELRSDQRYLIVNADDFGQSRGINRGIIEAFEQGILTSTSFMVRWPAAEEAATYAREHSDLSLGLHLDLSEWNCRNGEWECLYQVIDESDPFAVRGEIQRQLDTFCRIVGHAPTHIDSHHHVHLPEPAHTVLMEMCGDAGVPIRHCTPRVQYCGCFYGQDDRGESFPDAIAPQGLIRILTELQPGITELACHPGYADTLETMYRVERATELRSLCDPDIRAAINDLSITLISFRDVASLSAGKGATR